METGCGKAMIDELAQSPKYSQDEESCDQIAVALEAEPGKYHFKELSAEIGGQDVLDDLAADYYR